VAGTWPFATPWTGAATIEEYETVGRGNTGAGIATPDGLVQVRQSRQDWTDPGAVAVLTHRGGGGSGGVGNLPFDVAERWYVAELRRNDGVIRSPSGGSTSASLRVESGFRSGSDPVGPAWLGTQPPLKVFDVPPVMPEAALRANVRGIVVLAVTIAPDGTVTNARVLRSIPLLDAAALEAVRQWRYEPSTVREKPLTITVPVTF
jgi:TonB family protein